MSRMSPWEQEGIHPKLSRELDDAIKLNSDTLVESKRDISLASPTSFADISVFSEMMFYFPVNSRTKSTFSLSPRHLVVLG